MKRMMIVAGALALAACNQGAGGNDANASGGAAVSAPAGSQWTETAAKSPAGGFVLGNPNATVKLIEYGALSCGHCATFSRESKVGLQALIAKGTVSYEFRPFLLSPLDVPAFLLARCNGPTPFFPLSEQLFEAQPEWLGAAQTITPQEQASWQSLAPERLAPQLATKLGLDGFVAQRGIGAQTAQACLSDKAAIDELVKIREDGAKEFNISGTPTFIVNGRSEPTLDTWAKLEPALRAAGA